MLYNQIASSSEVRAAITDFLHARGYISDADIQRSRTADDDQDQPTSLQTMQTLSQLPDDRAARALIAAAQDQTLPREQRKRARLRRRIESGRQIGAVGTGKCDFR